MTRAISLAFLLLVGCGPSHLISLRTELPPVTDAQTRARLALGHRDDLTGAPAADLDRLRRLAELEVALGQRDEARATWDLALELARADVATARGPELQPTRARLEATRAWVIADARGAGADRAVLEALRDAVAAHHPDADPAAVTAKMFDVLMEQAAQRLVEADLDPNRERCLELLAERGVLRHLDTPWARIR